jgi:uncharacterized protein YjbI with pentapeptide repeats
MTFLTKSSGELQATLEEHQKWLDGLGGRCAYLRGTNLGGIDLRGANLIGADLRDADLTAADLREAKLSGAYLRWAFLRRADLSGADLSDADLHGANLHGANLRGAKLIGANLRGADLREANLREVNLSGAYLYGADLSTADLHGAKLIGAYLRGTDFSDADLRAVDLSWADLRDTDLSGARLSGADLAYTCLDSRILEWQRAFVAACPPDAEGYRTVYRTERSLSNGNTVYEPGKVYEAPYLSFSAETECHPGIYVGTLEQIRAIVNSDSWAGSKPRIVRGRIKDGDWVICEKGARTARFECLEVVEDMQ